MMFVTFFLTELKYVLKQKMIYIFTFLVVLLVFGAVVSDSVIIGGAVGNVYRNAPHVLTSYVTILTIFGLLFATAFFNNAALRENNYHFSEILFSTPLTKSSFYFGRFFSALLLSTIPMFGVFIGAWFGAVLGPLFGWMPAERFGSFYFSTVVNDYFLFILPNMFFAGAVIFTLSVKFKSTIISFVGALAVIVLYMIAGSLISDIDNQKIGALTDIFGIRAYTIVTKYYSPVDMNTKNPSFSGLLLWNRLIWMFVGLIILLFSYFNFSFRTKTTKTKKKRQKSTEKQVVFTLPTIHQQYNFATFWTQFKSFFSISFKSILRSITFKIILIFSLILILSSLAGGFEYFGLKMYPVTYHIMDVIDNSSSIFIMIILVFFSGELVWKDRDHKLNEVVDATSHASVTSILGKTFALMSVAILLYFVLILTGIGYQLAQGFTQIEWNIYALNFLQKTFFDILIYSCLFVLLQVVTKNKYLGYFLSILAIFLLGTILQMFHVESNMLYIGGRPSLMYSDISGFGPGVLSAAWFNAYWAIWGFVWLFFAGLLWSRGTKKSLLVRLKSMRKNISRGNAYLLTLLIVVLLGVSGFIYYNTQILNAYKTDKQSELDRVAFEQKYKKYENVLRPKITATDYNIAIYPEKRAVIAKTILWLKNETNQPIDSLHFVPNDDWETTINIPGGKLAYNDKELNYRIYTLHRPMMPNDSMKIEIETKFVPKGFENNEGNTSIVENGTFLNNMDILPFPGYSATMELSDPNKRKKYGLPPKERMPKLDSNNVQALGKNYLSNGVSDWTTITTTISTSADQTAIAPGSLVKKWTENGRNFFRYKVDHVSQNFLSFMSARYQKATEKWNGIDLEVYYDAKHAVNIPMMLEAMKHSLHYYIDNFGPYYHHQARIIEFPRYSTFAQAFPGTMPYAESFGFIVNLKDESKNNVIDAVIAHEMAHQWWAHQVIGATMQGATMLSESFAEYSSLMTMKKLTNDPMKMRQFLKYDMDRYLKGRKAEVEKELPLYKVENQMYLHYGKGSVILYALQDYIGEKKLNTTMRNFLEKYRYKNPPYPTSLDFLEALQPQVPDSLQYLINDWIKEITFYDLRTKKVAVQHLSNGKYQVEMTVFAQKFHADSVGNEKEVPINDWIDLGFFSDNDEKQLQYAERVKIDQKEQKFTFTLDKLPKKAAIDPRHLLIDRIYDDNSMVVEK